MGIPQNGHLRINIRKAMEHFDTVEFMEVSQGYNQLQIASADWMIQNVGDFIVRRAAFGTSYHLAVVVDDAAQQITHVTRGHDLFTASFLHVVLQKLLGLPTPLYFHHDLVTDADGKRLAKRDDAKAIALYRDQGLTPAQVLDLARPS
ncbi:MAG: glutamate--tRNA ligase family protein [Candidatus Promineifilaceae bacterium]